MSTHVKKLDMDRSRHLATTGLRAVNAAVLGPEWQTVNCDHERAHALLWIGVTLIRHLAHAYQHDPRYLFSEALDSIGEIIDVRDKA